MVSWIQRWYASCVSDHELNLWKVSLTESYTACAFSGTRTTVRSYSFSICSESIVLSDSELLCFCLETRDCRVERECCRFVCYWNL